MDRLWGFQEVEAYDSAKIVSPQRLVRPEGLCQPKSPMTQSGIEPATFQLVAQCLNQLRHRMALLL
jgi:hypothetical protein